ncbi:hypothetical protein HK405_015273, partial [Cladochytrium tenue]
MAADLNASVVHGPGLARRAGPYFRTGFSGGGGGVLGLSTPVRPARTATRSANHILDLAADDANDDGFDVGADLVLSDLLSAVVASPASAASAATAAYASPLAPRRVPDFTLASSSPLRQVHATRRVQPPSAANPAAPSLARALFAPAARQQQQPLSRFASTIVSARDRPLSPPSPALLASPDATATTADVDVTHALGSPTLPSPFHNSPAATAAP